MSYLDYEGLQVLKGENDALYATISTLLSSSEAIKFAPEFENWTFVTGQIQTDGGVNSTNTKRIRTTGTGAPVCKLHDVFLVESQYAARIAVYSSSSISKTTFVKFIGDTFMSGIIPIPDDCVGKVLVPAIRKVGHENDDISADIATIGNYIHCYRMSEIADTSITDALNAKFDGIPLYAEHEDAVGSAVYGSGTYNTSTGGTKSDNTKLRRKAMYPICIHKGDYIDIDPAYEFTTLIYSNANISSSKYVEVAHDWRNTAYYFPDAYIGSYCVMTIRKVGHESDDISSEADTINQYIHYYHTVFNGKYLSRAREFERFNVTTNSNVSPTNSTTTDTVADSFTAHNRRCIIALPDTYDPKGKPVPVIMMCHGQHGYVSSENWCGAGSDDSKFGEMISEYTDHGYAIFDVNQLNDTSGNESNDIGSPEQMAGYLAAWQYVKNHYNVQDTLLIQGYSQGSFAALNFLHRYPGMFKCGLFTGMRASIRAVFDRSSSYAAEIATKFGFADSTGSTYEADKVIGEDAYANIVWENASTPVLRWAIPPIKVVTSEADTTDYQVTYDTVLALRNGGNRVEWRILETATHGDVCCGDGFCEEYRMWFDRFR